MTGVSLLLTTHEKYDIVVSEPSNPYRAGVASLFTREYYESVASNLNNGGLFAQWLQGYDVDLRTGRIFYATLSTVFPHIETWQTETGDLLLICSKTPIRYDIDSMRSRLAAEPFHSAATNVWRTTDLEGVFSHYIGNEKMAGTVMRYPGIPLNTDDRMLLEFAFARSRQSDSGINFNDLRHDAALALADRPITHGTIDWKSVEEQRIAMLVTYNGPTRRDDSMSDEQARLLQAFNGYLSAVILITPGRVGNPSDASLVTWRSGLSSPSVWPIVATTQRFITSINSPRSSQRKRRPSALVSLWREKRTNEAESAIQRCIRSLQIDPWPGPALLERTLNIATDLVAN